MSSGQSTAADARECAPDLSTSKPPFTPDLQGSRPRSIVTTVAPLNIAAATDRASIPSPLLPPLTPNMCAVYRNSPPPSPTSPSPSPASVSPHLASRTELRRDLGSQAPAVFPRNTSRPRNSRTPLENSDGLKRTQANEGPQAPKRGGPQVVSSPVSASRSNGGSDPQDLAPSKSQNFGTQPSTSNSVRSGSPLSTARSNGGSNQQDLASSRGQSLGTQSPASNPVRSGSSPSATRSNRGPKSQNIGAARGKDLGTQPVPLTNGRDSGRQDSSDGGSQRQGNLGSTKASTPTSVRRPKESSVSSFGRQDPRRTRLESTTVGRFFGASFFDFPKKGPFGINQGRTESVPGETSKVRGIGSGQTTTQNANGQFPPTTSATRPSPTGQNQAQSPRSTAASGRNIQASASTERTQPTSRIEITRTSEATPTRGIQALPTESRESQVADQESATSTDQETSTFTEEQSSATREPQDSTSDAVQLLPSEDPPPATARRAPPRSSASATTTDTSSPRKTDSPRRPSPAVRSTLDTSASAGPANTPAAVRPAREPKSVGQLGNTGTENGIGGNLGVGNQPTKSDPRPSPGPSGPSQASRALPTKSVLGIVFGVAAAVLILGLSLWIGRKVWRKVQAKKKVNRLPSPFHDSSPSHMGQRDTSEIFGDAAGARLGAERHVASLGYHGAGVTAQADNPMAEATLAPQPWEPPAIPGQDMANVRRPMSQGPTMKDRFMGLWSKRPGDGAFEPAPRGRLPDGATSMGGGNMDATLQSGPVPELGLNQDGFGILNPFADTNVMNGTSHEPAYIAQAYMEGALDPFADPIAVPSPVFSRQESAFTELEPRSHRRSVSASVSSRYPPSTASARSSRYPPSMASRAGVRSSFRSLASSFADRRNKFRSDPFDLEIEGGLPNVDGIPEMPPLDNSNAAYMTHMRSGSQPSSFYTSGISSDWNLTRTTAAGPVIDPAAAAAYPPGIGGDGVAQSREWRTDGLENAK
ncbi:hypothetical protein XA68_10102 [Ophiocordyceps unilateralis]|uniref:Uncharacterized protein n=1 Tax=Ophiocordyceps unilateralis TaxID=268505 RepID=A0A2A9PQ34_OPHUN|nr:hypothetical protein XA68_10102 [Ophiocordyceps unilateralis]